MKLLITTRADSNIKRMTDITHPSIIAYAKKVGASFMTLDHKTDCTHMEGKWHYRILKHYDLFEQYDRILHIDSDVLVSPKCPNVFNLVPYDCIGTVYEDKGSRAASRHECIRTVQNTFGDVSWIEGYINTGFFLTSKIHRDIFKKIDGHYYEGWGHDDVHLGYLINRHEFKVHELSYKWNHMGMFSEPWNGSADRFDSNIIHYAGTAAFPGHNAVNNHIDSKIPLIESDIKVWWGSNYPSLPLE
jgi:lipopolysaccharide biosynthesis glycosyltransferase